MSGRVDSRDRMAARTGQNPRRFPFLTAATLAPAFVVAVLVVVVLGALIGDDGDDGIPVTGQAGELYLTPTGLDGRFRLVYAGSSRPDPGPPQPASYGRVFGRRAADGVALSQSVVITVTPGQFLDGSAAEPTTLRVLDDDMTVRRDPYGRRSLAWQQDDGRTVGVLTFGLADQELTALAGSLRGGGAETATPTLPPGVVSVFSGQMPNGSIPNTDQVWEAPNGDDFHVVVGQIAGVTLDDVARELPGGHAVQVRRATGIFSDRDGSVLTWIEAPDTIVSISSVRLDERELTEVAKRLQPVDEAEWRRLSTTPVTLPSVVVGPGPPGAGATESFFSVRPVIRSTDPPCVSAPSAATASVVAEVQAGQQVACHEVGPPALGADDVDSATARLDRVTGRWQVDFTLTVQGSVRFADLGRRVGGGGRVAIIVDGRLVNVPRLTTPAPLAGGTVSGLDEGTARILADRLQ